MSSLPCGPLHAAVTRNRCVPATCQVALVNARRWKGSVAAVHLLGESALLRYSRVGQRLAHQDGLDRGGVRRVGARESNRRLCPLEARELLLELDVQRVRPRERPVAGAQPVLVDRVLRGLLQPRLLRKAEVVARAEVEVVAAPDGEVRPLPGVNDARHDLVR